MLQGESHVSRSEILLLCNCICHMSRYAERSHKNLKKNNNSAHCEFGLPVAKAAKHSPSTSFWSHGHYLFPKAPSLLSENCSLLGTGNVRGKISVHIFAPSGGYWLFIHFGDETEYGLREPPKRTAGWTAGFVEPRSPR